MPWVTDSKGNLVNVNADGSSYVPQGKVGHGPDAVQQPGNAGGFNDVLGKAATTAAPVAAGPQWPTAPPPAAPVVPMTGDLAMNKKLQGETYFDAHKDDFTKPGDLEGFVRGEAAKGHAATTNNANEAFGMWKNSTPADMSSYYENAGRQGAEALRTKMAATGSYGSSAYNDQASELFGNLAADRAKNEAQYGLSRMQLGGSLAGAADSSSIAGSANERAWTTGLGGLFGNSDADRRAGLTSGMNAATSAENSYLNRVNSLFGDTFQRDNAKSGVVGGVNERIENNDKGLFGDQVVAGVAPYSEGAAQALGERAQSNSDRETTMKNSVALAKILKDSKNDK